jgi:outer membrane receptor protein involved in Fe transport
MRLVHVCVLILLFFTTAAIAQNNNVITGTVKNDATNESLSAISVLIKGSANGTYTDEKGFFKLSFSQPLPVTLVISSIGYATKEVTVSSTTEPLSILLTPYYELGQEIVVGASRVPERIMESPVSIERVNSVAIRNTPASSYYDMLGNLKGVDITTSSLTFKTPSTRGFNGSGNLRFNQFVDGMDNLAPALNFSVGNIIGLTELDVDNMELLPGSSSALYGSGGMNGTLLITSKNPFKYQGFSAQVKEGIMHIDDPRHKATPYHDISFRWGKKVSDKFAFKIGSQFIKAYDWVADDKTNLERNNVLSNTKPGTRTNDPNYDGINVFGDEASASMRDIALAGVFGPANISLPTVIQGLGINAADGLNTAERTQILTYYGAQNPAVYGPFLPILSNGILQGKYLDANGQPILVSRTGYDEADLVNYDTYNVKVSGGLYYKLNSNTEASLTGNWGMGSSVYTGADRYSLKNFIMGQYRLEVKSNNWFVRAYTTQENSGDSYASTIGALTLNDKWKKNAEWFGEYSLAYAAATLQGVPPDQAHTASRSQADMGRYLPGSAQFKSAFDSIIKIPIGQGGSRFADKSSLYHIEGQLNLSQYVKVVNVLVGASYRLYNLNSKGTIFADTTGPIKINEYGAYLQLQKQLFKDILKLTASGRYDKNENFEGRFTPRLAASIKVATDNNIRLSYQQAYRFPDVQDQYINLQTPGSKLIGGLPSFATYYHFDTNPVYTAASVVEYRSTEDSTKLQPYQFTPVKPERSESFEVGYRGVIARQLLIDAYFYSSKYKDFIGLEAVARGASGNPATSVSELASPFTSANFSFPVNSNTPVKATGWGIGIDYKLTRGYLLRGNVYSDELHDVQTGLVTFFNTPKYRYNIGVSNDDAFKGLGFNIIYKWQEKVYWEGTFGSGNIPAFGMLDAQISYKLTKVKSMIKLGATNLTNHYYRNSFGNPYVGGLYYVSLMYNVL